MATLSELKDVKTKLEKAIASPTTPENFKDGMKKKLSATIAEIDYLEWKQKTKIVKPRKEKKEKEPKEKPDKIMVEFLDGRMMKFSNPGITEKKREFADMVHLIKRPYIPISKKQYDEIMKFTQSPESDWLERANGDLFSFGNADNGYALMPHKDNVTSLVEKSKPEAEPKPESKDELAECKKLLTEANYEVKEKSVKGKDGKKRKIKTKEPRQDRTIIKDRTESVFTTMTKSYNSEDEKKENKDLLELVDTVKEIMVKFMVSLDKLVASKEVDKIKKIKELLNKLVD